MTTAAEIIPSTSGKFQKVYAELINSSNNIINDTIYLKYKIQDVEEGDTTYIGYADSDENWYILRLTSSETIFRYVAGTSDYATAWTNRGSQVYDYLYNITIN
jgi:hypothetical protein